MLIIAVHTRKFALLQNPTRTFDIEYGKCICLTAKADLNKYLLYSNYVDQCLVKRKRKAGIKVFRVDTEVTHYLYSTPLRTIIV